MSIKELLRSKLGITGYIVLVSSLKNILISIDAENCKLTIRQYGKEPFDVSFKEIEDFINNVN
jgi:hypothetical protein